MGENDGLSQCSIRQTKEVLGGENAMRSGPLFNRFSTIKHLTRMTRGEEADKRQIYIYICVCVQFSTFNQYTPNLINLYIKMKLIC